MRSFSENFYIGEHLIYGHVGHFLIILAFISAVFVSILGLRAYLKPETKSDDLKQIQNFYWIHVWSIIAIFGIIIFLFAAQYREYHYIWRHSSSELPWYFIFSAIWEGQEGSFLLWIFWHAILGLFLLRNIATSKLGALSILAIVQAFLLTMILGVDVFGKLIGTNPFILLRDEMSIPILANPNYLDFIKDGNGLNILLQNYWMTIHPPVLFLGFASATIPFGFAFSSLLKRDFTTWTKEVQPWALFSLGILGLGILMGGRWAYEALSFGGFWAWDPVENASLVPWLFLVAGLHTLMVYRATSHSLKATYIFFIFSFGFVLYSTFLTRSGILGDSSVHSFTDLGMTGQLLVFLGFLLIPAFLLLALFWSYIPQNEKEENTWSREFWMFLGMLFVLVSAIQISFTTSIPVWNKLFDLKLAPPINANEHYNSIQIWFSISVCFLMGSSLWLFYKDTKEQVVFKKILLTLATGLGIAFLTAYIRDYDFVQQYSFIAGDYKVKFKFISSFLLLLWASIFLVISSILYLYDKLRNQTTWSWGGSIAHIGFGLLILGALISQYEKRAISINRTGVDFGKEFNANEQSSNTLLMMGTSEIMGDYSVTYRKKSAIKQGETYALKFINNKRPSDSFILNPEAKIIKEGANNRLNPEPAIRHLLNKDLFVHVSSVPEDHSEPRPETKNLKIRDTFFAKNSRIHFDTIYVKSAPNANMIDIEAILVRSRLDNEPEILKIPYRLNTETGMVYQPIITSFDSTIKINLLQIKPDSKEFEFSILDTNKAQDWIIVKALEFPHISILWLGCIIMTIGTLMSMRYRKTKTLRI